MVYDKNIRILVVDDFPTMRRIVRSLLRKNGFLNVKEASDGAIALEMVKKGDFDLIISDWNMPKMNGFELLAAIRESHDQRTLQFLMVVTPAFRGQAYQSLEKELNGYLVKPFTADTLNEEIKRAMGW